MQKTTHKTTRPDAQTVEDYLETRQLEAVKGAHDEDWQRPAWGVVLDKNGAAFGSGGSLEGLRDRPMSSLTDDERRAVEAHDATTLALAATPTAEEILLECGRLAVEHDDEWNKIKKGAIAAESEALALGRHDAASKMRGLAASADRQVREKKPAYFYELAIAKHPKWNLGTAQKAAPKAGGQTATTSRTDALETMLLAGGVSMADIMRKVDGSIDYPATQAACRRRVSGQK
jgi:hypothetical protein